MRRVSEFEWLAKMVMLCDAWEVSLVTSSAKWMPSSTNL